MIQIKEESIYIKIFWEDDVVASFPKALWSNRFPKCTADTKQALVEKIEDLLAKKAYSYALKYLQRQLTYSAYLHKILIRKGFSSSLAQKTIEKLQKQSYLSDDSYIEAVIYRGIAQKQSPLYLLRKLLEKQVPQQAAKAAIERIYTPEEEERVIEKLRRRYASRNNQLFSAYLYRKGFSTQNRRFD